MDKTSRKNSLSPDYLPILSYLKEYLRAKGWKVNTFGHPRDHPQVWATRKCRFREVKLSLELQQIGVKFYLIKIKIDSKLPILSPNYFLEQYGKSTHPAEEGLDDLWVVDSGIDAVKLFKMYNAMCVDLGEPTIF